MDDRMMPDMMAGNAMNTSPMARETGRVQELANRAEKVAAVAAERLSPLIAPATEKGSGAGSPPREAHSPIVDTLAGANDSIELSLRRIENLLAAIEL